MIRIGWRNLWRNKRRSLIMLGALVIGLWGLVMIYGANNGMLVGMVDMVILSNSAHIQVHARGYQDDPEMDLTIKNAPQIEQDIRGLPHVEAISARARTRALISSSHGSSGVMLMGIDPEEEARVTSVAKSIKQGKYFDENDKNGILIGESLAEKLKLSVGKKIVIYARGADNDLKVLGARVTGTFSTGNDAVDKFMVFVPLAYFQSGLVLDGQIHEIAVRIDDDRNLDQTRQEMVTALSGQSGLEILTWKEIYAFMQQLLDLAAISNYIMLIIVGVAISLGIANTMIMSVFERYREIGIMRAVGTRPFQIFVMVLVESVSLAVTGLVLGTIISWVTLLFWARHGLDLSMFSSSLGSIGMPSIIYPIVYPADWIMTFVAVVVMAVGSSIYPAIKAARKNPVEAIRM